MSLPINQIIEGDCLKILPTLHDKSFDLLYTDFPYGMNKDFGNGSDSPELSKYLMEKSLEESFRVLRWDSPALFWFNPSRVDLLIDALRKARFTFRRMLWMYKPNDVCFPYYSWLMTSEAIVLASKGELKLTRTEGKYDHDTYIFKHEDKDNSFEHPSVKPLRITEKLIANLTKEGDYVLDFFSGSGTTALACQKLKRNWLGIEINPQYCEIARKRIQTWLEQRRLV